MSDEEELQKARQELDDARKGLSAAKQERTDAAIGLSLARIAQVSALTSVALREVALAVRPQSNADLEERIENITEYSKNLWDVAQELFEEVLKSKRGASDE